MGFRAGFNHHEESVNLQWQEASNGSSRLADANNHHVNECLSPEKIAFRHAYNAAYTFEVAYFIYIYKYMHVYIIVYIYICPI